MRITTKLTIDMNSGAVLEHTWYEYSGRIAECKKGRSQLNSAANGGVTAMNSGQSLVNQGQGIANSEINTAGGLSPLVSRQLANQSGMISKAYSGQAEAADRGLSQRGFGSAPSGMAASIKNTAINNAGQAQTGAVGNSFGEQNVLNNSSLSQPINALNATTGAVNSTTNAGSALNKAGSTWGDIGSGISGLSGIGNSMFGQGGLFGGINPLNRSSFGG